VIEYEGIVASEQEGADAPRIQCTYCSRHFVDESFKKHFLACEKVFLRLRPEFISVK